MDEQISRFVAVTGAPAERASFFLESSGGDLEAAIATYYESEGGVSDEMNENAGSPGVGQSASASAADSRPAATSGPRTLSGAPAEPLPEGWGSSSNSGATRRTTGSTRATGGGGGIRTFRDLSAQQEGSRGGDSDDSDREPENLFAGGERSGLNVQNPDARRRADHSDAVKEILRQAAQNGPHPDDAPSAGGSTTAAAPSFGGTGRTIADESASSQEATQSSSNDLPSIPGALQAEDEDESVAVRHLNFWQDGFSIEDGPLRSYDDPESKALLAAIESQTAPPSAFNIKFGQKVEIRVSQRLSEKYRPPPPAPLKAFSGGGNRLGSPAPAVASTSASTGAASAAPSAAQQSAAQAPQVDEAKPVTQVQIRLADGSRLLGRFNHDHTVADIRSFIDASQAAGGSRSYALQASFPPKPVEDEQQTLKDAGLINAVVLQKWT
ncbi:unnamed protein product [Parajaminaea phylloscopi]